MGITYSRRSNIALYVDKTSINSHRIRMIISEKNIPIDIIEVNKNNLSDELLKINPYGTLPILVDRDLALYDASIITEYFEERFPHPPLLPIYPIARAKTRLMALRIEREWLSLVDVILNGEPNNSTVKEAQKKLLNAILGFLPVFSSMPFFLSDELSILDCCVGPLLWHLPALGIQLPSSAKPIQDYLMRISARASFKASLVYAEPDYESV